MFRFQHNEYFSWLILLPVLIAAYLYVLWWKRRSIKKIGDQQLVEQLFTGYSPRLYLLKFLLLTGAFAICVIGLANLQMGSRMEKITRKGVDVMIALDVSKSMLADDIKPNRLDRAKQFINKLLDKLNNDRVGLVIFAGNAYLQMPLTIDYSAAKMYLGTVSPEMIPTQGTVIGQAIRMSDEAFNQNERKHKALILISDGEDHDETALDAAKKAFENGVVINTIGIGSPQGAPIKDPETGDFKKDNEGNIVVSKLNEAELRSIAAAGRGIYQYLDNTDQAVKNIMDKLDSIEQKEFGENLFTDYESYFQYFLGLGLLLILIEFFLPEKQNTGCFKSLDTQKNS